MTPIQRFERIAARMPLVAIIRGVEPEEAVTIGRAILAGGIEIIEVPLNSPRPFESIGRLADALGDEVLIGAGTVLAEGDVAKVAQAGGALVVSPCADVAVIRATVAAGMVSLPGVFTPTEAFTALGAGAHGLKLFPAEGASPAVLKAIRAVLPRELAVMPVGGVRPETVAEWRRAGASGFGLGSSLYSAGQSREETERRARAFAEAWSASEAR